MLLEYWQQRFCILLLLEGRKSMKLIFWVLQKARAGMDLKEVHKSFSLMDLILVAIGLVRCNVNVPSKPSLVTGG